ncbi:MAG: hypothetical protein QME81_11590, partial [bacterium]|nr:hypothetical protein [bacterium]
MGSIRPAGAYRNNKFTITVCPVIPLAIVIFFSAYFYGRNLYPVNLARPLAATKPILDCRLR